MNRSITGMITGWPPTDAVEAHSINKEQVWSRSELSGRRALSIIDLIAGTYNLEGNLRARAGCHHRHIHQVG